MSTSVNVQRVGVIDLGLSNIGSVVNMLKKSGARPEVVPDPRRLADYDRLVLPGVGAFDRGMERLEQAGWSAALQEFVIVRGKPILGICLGLQLFCRGSEEGTWPGLGWLDADVVRLNPAASGNASLRVPHMGWNEVRVTAAEPLFRGANTPQKFYFLHSYRVRCSDESMIQATCRYGETFPCVLKKKNVVGVQFHPEKSHSFGLRLLRNFAEAA